MYSVYQYIINSFKKIKEQRQKASQRQTKTNLELKSSLECFNSIYVYYKPEYFCIHALNCMLTILSQ